MGRAGGNSSALFFLGVFVEYRTAHDVLVEGGKLHEQARGDPQLSKAARAALFNKVEREYYDWVLHQNPDDWAALNAYGCLAIETSRYGLATALFRQALVFAPKDHEVLRNLGAAYLRLRDVKRARDTFKQALKYAPTDTLTLSNLASTYINEDASLEALKWADKALECDPTNDDALFTKGMAELELGRYETAWDGYEAKRKLSVWHQRNYGEHVPVWDGTPDKTVVIYGEQGVGDEVLFASCVPDALTRCKKVIFDCHPRLATIFKRAFPDCVIYPTRKEHDIAWPGEHEIDAKIAIGSLPVLFRRSLASFPAKAGYLTADPELVAKYKKPGLRVGLSWIGGTKDTRIELRSIAPSLLAELFKVPGVDEWVSLQYTPGAGEQVAAMRKDYGVNLTHDDAMNASLDDQFACISGLDFVVTVCTSVVHFAGALGVKALVMTPRKSAWRYTTPTMPWFPQHDLIRQEKPGEWADVIERVKVRMGQLTHAH